MPKVHQVLPIEVQAFAQQPKKKERQQKDKEINEQRVISAVTSKSGGSGKHYFQQFSGTKRFVSTILKQQKRAKTIESDLAAISSELDMQETRLSLEMTGPTAVFDMNRTPSGPTLEVHHGVNTRDFSQEDRNYFHMGLTTTGESDGGAGSPERVFNERKSIRVKKLAKQLKTSKIQLKQVREDNTFPDWLRMREAQMSKLEIIVRAVMSRTNDHELLQHKRDFLFLIPMIQQTTLKIVEYYLDHREEYQAKFETKGLILDHGSYDASTMEESFLRWNDLENYVENLPTSLNWLEENPFRLWCGVHFTFNPFIACYDLHNDLAVMMNETMHRVLQANTTTTSSLFALKNSFSLGTTVPTPTAAAKRDSFYGGELLNDSVHVEDQTPQYLPDVMSIMAKEIRYDAAFHHRLVRASTGLAQIYRKTVERHQVEQAQQQSLHRQQQIEQEISPDIARYNRLTFLIFGSARQEELDTLAMIVQNHTVRFNTQHYWHLWQRVKYYKVVIRYMANRRKARIFHWTLSGLQRSRQQKEGLLALRKRCQHSLLHVILQRWQENLLWWKRFDALQYRCNLHRQQLSMDAWQEYLEIKQRRRMQCLMPLMQPEVLGAHQHQERLRKQLEDDSVSRSEDDSEDEGYMDVVDVSKPEKIPHNRSAEKKDGRRHSASESVGSGDSAVDERSDGPFELPSASTTVKRPLMKSATSFLRSSLLDSFRASITNDDAPEMDPTDSREHLTAKTKKVADSGTVAAPLLGWLRRQADNWLLSGKEATSELPLSNTEDEKSSLKLRDSLPVVSTESQPSPRDTSSFALSVSPSDVLESRLQQAQPSPPVQRELNRFERREAEEQLAASLAGAYLRQQRHFRVWLKTYRLHRALRLWTTVNKDYQRRMALQKWRRAVKEFRFEDKVRARTQEMLAELYASGGFEESYDEYMGSGSPESLSRSMSRSVSRRNSMQSPTQPLRLPFTRGMSMSDDLLQREEESFLANHNLRGSMALSMSPTNRQVRRKSVASRPPDAQTITEESNPPPAWSSTLPVRVIPADYKPAYNMSQVPVIYRRRSQEKKEQEEREMELESMSQRRWSAAENGSNDEGDEENGSGHGPALIAVDVVVGEDDDDVSAMSGEEFASSRSRDQLMSPALVSVGFDVGVRGAMDQDSGSPLSDGRPYSANSEAYTTADEQEEVVNLASDTMQSVAANVTEDVASNAANDLDPTSASTNRVHRDELHRQEVAKVAVSTVLDALLTATSAVARHHHIQRIPIVSSESSDSSDASLGTDREEDTEEDRKTHNIASSSVRRPLVIKPTSPMRANPGDRKHTRASFEHAVSLSFAAKSSSQKSDCAPPLEPNVALVEAAQDDVELSAAIETLSSGTAALDVGHPSLPPSLPSSLPPSLPLSANNSPPSTGRQPQKTAVLKPARESTDAVVGSAAAAEPLLVSPAEAMDARASVHVGAVDGLESSAKVPGILMTVSRRPSGRRISWAAENDVAIIPASDALLVDNETSVDEQATVTTQVSVDRSSSVAVSQKRTSKDNSVNGSISRASVSRKDEAEEEELPQRQQVEGSEANWHAIIADEDDQTSLRNHDHVDEAITSTAVLPGSRKEGGEGGSGRLGMPGFVSKNNDKNKKTNAAAERTVSPPRRGGDWFLEALEDYNNHIPSDTDGHVSSTALDGNERDHAQMGIKQSQWRMRGPKTGRSPDDTDRPLHGDLEVEDGGDGGEAVVPEKKPKTKKKKKAKSPSKQKKSDAAFNRDREEVNHCTSELDNHREDHTPKHRSKQLHPPQQMRNGRRIDDEDSAPAPAAAGWDVENEEVDEMFVDTESRDVEAAGAEDQDDEMEGDGSASHTNTSTPRSARAKPGPSTWSQWTSNFTSFLR